jgi:Domain of unknown function (DUF4410)
MSSKRTKYFKHSTLFLSVFGLLLLAACSGQQAQTKPESAQFASEPRLAKAYSVIFVEDVAAGPEIQKDYPDALGECQANILQGLHENKRYQQVASKPSDGTRPEGALLIQSKITDMRIVGGIARMFGGALAGSSYMNIDVKLVEAATNKTIREKTIASSNNAFGAAWTNGSSDRSLPTDMGKIIAQYVNSIMPKNMTTK